MNLLLSFILALHGPGLGCSWSSYISRSCSQEPGQAKVCKDYGDEVGGWWCDGFEPGWLAFDLDSDLDVDLRDFAKLQNEWRPE